MTAVNVLELAVNHAMQDFAIARMRAGLLGGGSMDSKRPQSWCEFGFPEVVGFSELYSLYRRGGVAHGAINKLVGTCWQTLPWVIEGDEFDDSRPETVWERKLKPTFGRGAFWRAFREADRRRLVGRFSGLILHFADDQKWHEPVKGRPTLVRMTPTWESSLQPTERDAFGKVKAWTYKGADGTTETVHPDRVFILGDYGPDAIGFLEPAFNAFVSLEKVEGGSGEAFLKNAARQLSIDFDKEVDLSSIAAMYGVPIEELHKKFNDAARDVNRANDLLLITQGATTTPLVSNVPDPRPTYDVNLQTASCALDIPSRILVGNQQGERASTEDQKYFNARCQSRRNELSVEISDLLAHLMKFQAVPPKDDFTVMWDDLAEAAPADKLMSAKTMADINAVNYDGVTFTDDEIRVAAGYEASDQLPPLPDDDDDET